MTVAAAGAALLLIVGTGGVAPMPVQNLDATCGLCLYPDTPPAVELEGFPELWKFRLITAPIGGR